MTKTSKAKIMGALKLFASFIKMVAATKKMSSASSYTQKFAENSTNLEVQMTTKKDAPIIVAFFIPMLAGVP